MKKIFTLFALALMSYTQSFSANNEADTSMLELTADSTKELISQEEEAKLIEIAKEARNKEVDKIQIISTHDSRGTSNAANRYAYIKALFIGEWFKDQNLNNEKISYIGSTLDPNLMGYSTPRKVNIFGNPNGEVAIQQSASKDKFSWSEQLNYIYLRTNLLYFAGGLFNVGMEYKRPESDFGFILNGGYSPFSSNKWDRNLGGWFVSPEVRYYIPKSDNWFVGAQFLYGGYNVKVFKDEEGRQGHVLGIGAMGGYKMELSKNFDMDFTLGLGYTKFDYDVYDRVDGYNVYAAKGVKKSTVLPIQAGVNLIYKIK